MTVEVWDNFLKTNACIRSNELVSWTLLCSLGSSRPLCTFTIASEVAVSPVDAVRYDRKQTLMTDFEIEGAKMQDSNQFCVNLGKVLLEIRFFANNFSFMVKHVRCQLSVTMYVLLYLE